MLFHHSCIQGVLKILLFSLIHVTKKPVHKVSPSFSSSRAINRGTIVEELSTAPNQQYQDQYQELQSSFEII